MKETRHYAKEMISQNSSCQYLRATTIETLLVTDNGNTRLPSLFTPRVEISHPGYQANCANMLSLTNSTQLTPPSTPSAQTSNQHDEPPIAFLSP
jgi:hypothetical protein